MTNQRARSVKTKIEPMYFYIQNAELKKLGFAFSKAILREWLKLSVDSKNSR